MKLSETQQHVIDRMESGWQLGTSMDLRGHSWIQKYGCGSGGDAEDVHGNTVHALLDGKLIVVDSVKFPLRTYKLAEEKK